MGPDDFVPIINDEDRLIEIADAVSEPLIRRIAALESELAAARRCPLCGGRTQEIAVKVKPLVWEDDSIPTRERAFASTEIGGYSVVKSHLTGVDYWVTGPGGRKQVDGDFEAAKAAAQADYERRVISALECAPVQSVQDRPSVAEGAVSEHFHDEQVRIWTQEILEALALHDQYRPETYDDKVVAREVIARELVDIGKAIDTMRMTSRAALRAVAGEDGQHE
jgi:hypothetical protein